MTFESATVIIGLLVCLLLAGLAAWTIISTAIEEGRAQREFELGVMRLAHSRGVPFAGVDEFFEGQLWRELEEKRLPHYNPREIQRNSME